MPSISMTPRPAKCRMDCWSRAGQLVLIQRLAASPSSRTTSPPHTGQCVGIRNGRRSEPCFTSRTTLGITSPLRSTRTRSPISTPKRPISSSLCSEARHGNAADVHRLQKRNRRQRAGPSYKHLDVFDNGLSLVRGEFERDRPARRLRGPAQSSLFGDRVHLEHHAVDLIRQRFAFGLPMPVKLDHVVETGASRLIRIYFKSRLLEHL